MVSLGRIFQGGVQLSGTRPWIVRCCLLSGIKERRRGWSSHMNGGRRELGLDNSLRTAFKFMVSISCTPISLRQEAHHRRQLYHLKSLQTPRLTLVPTLAFYYGCDTTQCHFHFPPSLDIYFSTQRTLFFSRQVCFWPLIPFFHPPSPRLSIHNPSVLSVFLTLHSRAR